MQESPMQVNPSGARVALRRGVALLDKDWAIACAALLAAKRHRNAASSAPACPPDGPGDTGMHKVSPGTGREGALGQ